jgi:hypothetical protein
MRIRERNSFAYDNPCTIPVRHCHPMAHVHSLMAKKGDGLVSYRRRTQICRTHSNAHMRIPQKHRADSERRNRKKRKCWATGGNRGAWWSRYIRSARRHDLVASRRAAAALLGRAVLSALALALRDSWQVPGVLSLRIMHARVVTSPRFIGSSGASDEQSYDATHATYMSLPNPEHGAEHVL